MADEEKRDRVPDAGGTVDDERLSEVAGGETLFSDEPTQILSCRCGGMREITAFEVYACKTLGKKSLPCPKCGAPMTVY